MTQTTKDGVTIPRRFPITYFGKRCVVDVHTPWRGYHRAHLARWFIFGNLFGPVAAIRAQNCEDALDEWDEHYGERVCADDIDLSDYGDTYAEQIEKGLENGDIRINDGGTTVWVDPHEWFEERRKR